MSDTKYKTGDRHPTLNQLAFVEYNENGEEEWCSTYWDKNAPWRLRENNTQNRLHEKQLAVLTEIRDEISRLRDKFCSE